MKRVFFIPVLLGLALPVGGCGTPRGAALSMEVLRDQKQEIADFQVVAVNRANLPTLAQWPVTGTNGLKGWLERGASAPSSVIRPGDKVDITIWDSQENSLFTSPNQKVVQMQGMVVAGNGTIFLPYTGEVLIRGLTPSDARAKVQTALSVAAPSVQVQLSSASGTQNTVDVVTGVGKPGSYPLADRSQTILGIIAEAGGIPNSLRNPVVRLIRADRTYEIWSRHLLDSAQRNVVLRGGDKVLIEQDERYFTALGASSKEEIVHFSQPRITALEAMSMMGGLAETRANPKGVLVLRKYPVSALRPTVAGPQKAQVVFTFDLTSADGLFAAREFQINPLDTVLATESPVVGIRAIAGLVGSVFGLADRLN